MKKYLLFICVLLAAFKPDQSPEGWTEIEKTKIGGADITVYFFDYLSKVEKLQPDYLQYKGRDLTNFLEKIQFQYPAYVAKRSIIQEDSVIYFILRPNEKKKNTPFYFDLEIVKTHKDFALQLLEDKAAYQDKILKITDATGCRGGLLSEYNKIIQSLRNKDEIIGNGIRITDSIYTRVLPYKEIKAPLYKLIESNL
jgi:hypothetical protein